MKTFIFIRGYFNGIYTWGRGFTSSAAAEAWKRFWNDIPEKTFFWRFLPPRPGRDGSGTLAASGCVIYMHPMDFETVFECRSSYGARFTLDELYRICTAAAQACGGSFTMYASAPTEVEEPAMKPYIPK